MGDTVPLIREMKPEDAGGIAKIYTEITKKPVEADFDKLIHAHALEQDSACFVAELDGKVIGFMISYVLTLGFGIDKSGWIATLGVDPRHMGGGIGARLAEESFKFYKSQGIKRVYTSVRWDSTDLLSFFGSLKFERSDFINLTKDLA